MKRGEGGVVVYDENGEGGKGRNGKSERDKTAKFGMR